jgi:NADH dehydrogenase
MLIHKVCVLGGTGFVGRHLLNRFTRERFQLRVPTRRRERHRDLLVMPTVDVIEADVHDPEVLRRLFEGCDAVVNLVGILNERGDDGSGFNRAHVELAGKVVAACQATGVRRLLHMSALNAGAGAPSHYLRSKGLAEDLVFAASSNAFKVTSFRPSVIFGPEDSFLNRFASLLRMTPVCFPLARAKARFSPVYVNDVAEAFTVAMTDPDSYGQGYDLCGPKVYTLGQLVQYVNELIGTDWLILPLSDGLSRMQAAVLERVPGKPFSRDNLRSLSVDSVCTGDNGLRALGITPTVLEAVAPAYLAQRRSRGLYSEFRNLAGRLRS